MIWKIVLLWRSLSARRPILGTFLFVGSLWVVLGGPLVLAGVHDVGPAIAIMLTTSALGGLFIYLAIRSNAGVWRREDKTVEIEAAPAGKTFVATSAWALGAILAVTLIYTLVAGLSGLYLLVVMLPALVVMVALAARQMRRE